MNRFTAIACAALIGVSLAGCSGGSGSSDGNAGSGTGTAETLQFSSFVSDMFEDDANAKSWGVNDVELDTSSDNENENAFEDELR